MSSLAEAGDKVGSVSTSDDKIVTWRQEQLELAGFNTLHARKIAERHSGPDAYDLHKVIEEFEALVFKGCDPHVAADIVT